MIMNSIFLIIIAADLVCSYKRFKFEKRTCKAYEDLTIETKKATEVLKEREEKTAQQIVGLIIDKVGKSIREANLENEKNYQGGMHTVPPSQEPAPKGPGRQY